MKRTDTRRAWPLSSQQTAPIFFPPPRLPFWVSAIPVPGIPNPSGIPTPQTLTTSPSPSGHLLSSPVTVLVLLVSRLINLKYSSEDTTHAQEPSVAPTCLLNYVQTPLGIQGPRLPFWLYRWCVLNDSGEKDGVESKSSPVVLFKLLPFTSFFWGVWGRKRLSIIYNF